MKKLTSLLKGLVLHLPLNQESYNPATKRFSDKTPYSNHGTSANAASFTTDRMGNSNQATTFNGSSDYANCGSDASLDITDAITISTWIKPDSYPDGTELIKYINASSAGGYFLGLWNTQKIGVYLSDVGGWYISDSTVPTTWTHVIFTWDGSHARIYKNGVLNNTPTIASGNIINTGNILIGHGLVATHPTDRFFDGSLADVRIYNRALSTSEIKLLYNSYNPRVII